MPVANGVIARVAAVLACVGLSMPAAGSPVLWRNDWYGSAPLTMNHLDLSTRMRNSDSIAFAPDRDVLLAAPSVHMLRSYRDAEQIVRLRHDGTVRWASSIGGYGDDGAPSKLYPEADGGATVLVRLPGNPGMVVRLDASGGVVWQRWVSGGRIHRISPSRLAIASCSRASVLDASNGNVVWQRALRREPCVDGGFQVDGEGNLYVLSGAQRDGSLHYRITRLDASGNEGWHQERTGEPYEMVAIGSSSIYLKADDELEAVRTSDGSVAWTTSAWAVVLGGAPSPEPVVFHANSVMRLNAETGQPRWATLVPGVEMANAVAGSLLLASGARRQRIDLASGAIIWDVPDIGDSIAWLAFGDLNANTVRAIGRPASLDHVAAPYLDYRVDYSNGQIVSELPAIDVQQGLDSISAMDADGDVVEFAVSQQPGYAGMHLRRVDGSTGTTLWEQGSLLDDLGPEVSIELQQGRMATAGDHVAIAVPLSDHSWSSNCGAAGTHVAVYDRISGALRWKRLLRDPDQLCTEASSPVMDDAGNVLLSISAKISCNPWPPRDCQRRSLYKLRGTDGSVVWRVDEDMEGLEFGSPSDPKVIHMVGHDPVVMGPFAAEAATLRRYSGADGSIRWTSFEFAGTSELLWELERIDDRHVIFHGGDLASEQRSSAKIDLEAGTTLWRAVSSPSPAPACESVDHCLLSSNSIVMPGGDVLRGVQLNWMPWLTLARNDGSGLVERWQAAPGSVDLDSGIVRIMRDAEGLRGTLRRGSNASSMTLLTTIDSSTGLLAAQQALYGDSFDLTQQEDKYAPLALPSANRMIAACLGNGPPAPPTGGLALLDTTVVARGNLKAVAAIDTRVSPGAIVPFAMRVEYEGDNPVEGVRLFAHLPWQSGIRNATCSEQGASSCSMDLRSGHVRASFDMAPGGSVEVRGEVLVLDAPDSLQVTAMVTGPLDLAEEDSIDNFDRIDISQSMFRDGFDPAR